jgi:hypothetical protein
MITKKQFNQLVYSETDLKVYSFLEKNKLKAFTYKEICEKLPNISPASIRNSLSYLKFEGKIKNKNPYWALL